MGLFDRLTERTEHYIRSYVIGKLHQRRSDYRLLYPNDMASLKRVLRPGDVILIEGDYWVSDWIKVFSCHTWTHCVMWLGESPAIPAHVKKEFIETPGNVVESVMRRGVIFTNLEKYRDFNLRICRPIGLSREQLRRLFGYIFDRVGAPYDEHNVTQFVHFTFANTYDPTRPLSNAEGAYTCSSLLAAAFQSIGMPVLHFLDQSVNEYVPYHYSNIQPKDFDLSLNFRVIKTPALLPQGRRGGAIQRLRTAFLHRFVY